MRDTRVVDQDVNATQPLHRRLGHRMHVGRDRHVGTDPGRTGGVSHAPGGRLVAVGHQHARTFGDELAHDALAEA